MKINTSLISVILLVGGSGSRLWPLSRSNYPKQYLNIEQKPGCKKLIQKHGLKVPKVGLFDEPKVKTNEWFWLECHKPQATNNLKIFIICNVYF